MNLNVVNSAFTMLSCEDFVQLHKKHQMSSKQAMKFNHGTQILKVIGNS